MDAAATSPLRMDLLALLAAIAIYSAYNYVIWLRLRRNPIYTIQGATSQARKAWVVSVMEDRKDILAVQTLRNSTMAATFMASTAILLAVGVLSLTGQGDKLAQTWHALNHAGSTSQDALSLKLLVLLANLCVAFFSFSSSIRLFNHVGFLINVPCTEGNYASSLTFVALQLNRAASHFHNGMRAFYFMIPLVFWLFGPLLLVGTTLMMVLVVYFLDRTPRMDYDYITAFEHKTCKL